MWSSQVFVLATKDVSEATMAKMPGKFLTKVYQGPYSEVAKWIKDMQSHVNATKGQESTRILAWYPYCPKCIKVHGENFVVMLALID